MAGNNNNNRTRQRRPRRRTIWNLSFYFVVTVLTFALASFYMSARRSSASSLSSPYGNVVTSLELTLQGFADSVSHIDASAQLQDLFDPATDRIPEDDDEEEETEKETGESNHKSTGSNNGSSDALPLPLAGLSCERFGGPPEEIAKEMVYWEDIPSDRYCTVRE